MRGDGRGGRAALPPLLAGRRAASGPPNTEMGTTTRGRALLVCGFILLGVLGQGRAANGLPLPGHPPPERGDRAEAVGRVVLIFRGRPVTVRDLAVVGYKRGLSACERACKRWPPIPGARLIKFSLGGPAVWPERPQLAAKILYDSMLRDAVGRFLRYQVVRRMEKQYHPRVRGQIDRAALEEAIVDQSRIEGHYYQFLLRHAVRDRSFTRFRAQLERRYPVAIYGPPGATHSFWHSLVVGRPYLYAMVHSFPVWAAGVGAAPWSRYSIYCGLAQTELSLIFRRDPEKYIRIDDTRYGQWHMLVASPVTNSRASRRATRDLMRSLGSRAGSVAFRGLEAAGRALGAVGSPTRLGVAQGEASIIRDMFGIKCSQLAPRELLRSGPGSGEPHALVFMLDGGPPADPVPKGWPPALFYYGTYYRAILWPIARHVLRRARAVMKGLKLPSVKALVSRVFVNSGYLGVGSELGRRVPRVILRAPWRPGPY